MLGAAPAPWAEAEAVSLQDAESLQGATLTLQADRVEGPDPLGCAGAGYHAGEVPPEGLFQGSLVEGEQAAALGFSTDAAATADVASDTGLFSCHLRDPDTVLFALNNVVHAMTREPLPEGGSQ